MLLIKFTNFSLAPFVADYLDCSDLVTICLNVSKCRFYFPDLKERSRFKNLIKMSTEETEVSIFVPCNFFPPVEESLVIVSWPGYTLVNSRDL